ncbi:MAG: hypothetical protein RL328_820, partial [Acidobacteriota bacterium]
SDFQALERLYVQAVEQARRAGNPKAQVSYLTALGNTYVYLCRYTEALRVYLEARDLARDSDDWVAAGAVAPGLSSIHFLVGDWESARNAVRDGLEDAAKAGVHPYYEAQLRLQQARLSPGGPGSLPVILEAIESSRMQSNVALEAQAWDLLGEEHLRQRDFPAAESALSEAHRIRLLMSPRDLHLSYSRLGALRLAQGRFPEAAQFTDSAISFRALSNSELLAGTLLQQRGLIRLAQGKTDLALQDLERAEDSAERWRAVVPPRSQSSLTAADAELDRNVARAFIETAAHQALQHGDAHWAQAAFTAAERNRAASLRQAAELAEVWRQKLSPDYWTTLARLRMQEAELLRRPDLAAVTEGLHRKLSEMEATVGLGYSPKNLESFPTQGSLTLFQRGLSESNLLLSFYVGAKESYLWAVTNRSLHLYRLPPADQLRGIVSEFQRAIAQHEAWRPAGSVYEALLGELTPAERGKRDWLLSLDGSLFDLPFSALRANGRYLVEDHSLQVTPAAAFLHQAAPLSSRRYLGVADPIYNSADSRLAKATASAPGQLNRLVASRSEVERSAGDWTGSKVLLLGGAARRAALTSQLNAGQFTAIHFATHVVAAEGQEAKSFLALSMGDTNTAAGPELLGAPDIAMLRVPGSLVVMTGCASGVGEVRAGAGLMGLTRAWLAAGAAQVLSTQWQVEDSRGDLLPQFFQQYPDIPAAEALRRSQVAMLNSGSWQADPAYWAAFQLTGGAH